MGMTMIHLAYITALFETFRGPVRSVKMYGGPFNFRKRT